MKNILLLLCAALIIFTACKKPQPDPDPDPVKLSFESLTASKTSVKVWDTVYLEAKVIGLDVSYSWNYGDGNLFPDKIHKNNAIYYGGPCCRGMNEIVCTATNSSGKVSKSVTIEVK